MPAVSVIMNIRNGAAYLREAIDSVLGQTFTDWELIAWDDCSTDDSAAIVAEYNDPRIRYFLATQDVPLGKARQLAITLAEGTWLAFLDQDDVWAPRKLERQLALGDAEVGIIYGRTLLFYPNGCKRDYDYAHEFGLLPEGDIFGRLFTEACFIAMSSAVLRRSAVLETGGIPDNINLVPDYYLYAAVARRYQARAVQDVVCLYRMHAGNMSATRRPELHLEPLLVVNHWASSLDFRIVAQRRQTYSTVLALDEMRSVRTFAAGLKRLAFEGSFIWLCQRPFVHLYRALRRKMSRPYWKRITLSDA